MPVVPTELRSGVGVLLPPLPAAGSESRIVSRGLVLRCPWDTARHLEGRDKMLLLWRPERFVLEVPV